MTGTTRQVAVVLAAVLNVVVNALAGSGVFGVTTGEVSDRIETGITPAGWTFSIWSLIFVAVLVFAAYQALPRNQGPRYDGLALPFILANLLNPLWQLPWLTGNYAMAAVVIVGILCSLIWLYIRLDRLGMTRLERWVLGVPTSLFLAWLMVATTVNVTVALVAAGWEGSPVWPPLIVLLVAALGAVLLRRTGDVAFAAVLIWAFAGIYDGNVPSPPEAPLLTAAIIAGIVAFAAAMTLAFKSGREPLPVAD